MANTPGHRKDCEYLCSDRDLWVDCTCRSKFNKKRFLHWQKMARELVVEGMLRAAFNQDERSLPGGLAQEYLLQTASKQDSDVMEKILDKRRAVNENMLRILSTL